ncbi:MAG TPA: hypothetical protein VLA56_14660, partial [Pseudomonadales bacterium]|nr:hypothetical protein [Pseudomonadales bacterium]
MAKPLPIEFHAGRNVRAHVAREGFDLADFPTLLGAAGGPKWLVLYGLDRVLAPRVKAAARAASRPVDLIGASIGAWRFAAWLQDDPAAALDRLFDAYTDPRFFDGSVADFDGIGFDGIGFDALFRHYIDALLGAHGSDELFACDVARLHMVVSLFPESIWPVALRLGLAALRNGFGRDRFLRSSPRRVLCSTAPLPDSIGRAWPHASLELTRARLVDALRATAAVPGMIAPVAGLDPRGGGGRAIDGGIVDYHFDGTQAGAGFVLYPHFYATLTPGWFDKPFRRRRIAATSVDDLLLICPSPAFVASLPGGKVPDRA